jgi:hypothetical protein
VSDKPKVTKENYPATLAGLWAMAQLLEEAPLPEMLAAAERADSIGPLVDPTLYREKGRALAEDIEMLDALRHVQVVVQRIRRRKAGA